MECAPQIDAGLDPKSDVGPGGELGLSQALHMKFGLSASETAGFSHYLRDELSLSTGSRRWCRWSAIGRMRKQQVSTLRPAKLPQLLQRRPEEEAVEWRRDGSRSGSESLDSCQCPQFPALAIVLGIITDHRLVSESGLDGRAPKEIC